MIKYKTLTVGSMQCNCYLAYNNTTNEAVIVDPGAESDKIIKQISDLNLTPRSVILTHAHFDHIAAVDMLCKSYGIGIIVSNEDRSLLTDPTYNLSIPFSGEPVLVTTSEITTVNDEALSLIGSKFEFITTPGHTNGSMCIKVQNIIFTGDTLFYLSIGNEFPPYGSFKREISSIKSKLLSLEGDYICLPGHGMATSLEFERNNNQYIR